MHGCGLPFDTPLYNLEAIGDYVQEGKEPEASAGFMSLEEALSQCGEGDEKSKITEIEQGARLCEDRNSRL
ncbi:MAG: hypothetical protein Q4D58_03775 [Synergistaceae bacterium]|nr:hypothetical protein [Synergistaceae bacterium]